MTVDAYAHCGRDKYLPVEVLDGVMVGADVSAAVLCQHLGQFDNAYLAGIVASEPGRFAGVALVDHEAATWRDDLASRKRAGLPRPARPGAGVRRESRARALGRRRRA